MSPQFTTDAKIPGLAVTREMVVLKKQLGGQYGKLELNGKEISVLRLDDSNYVTGKVDPSDKALLAVAGIDLHPIANAWDAQFLRAKYRRYYGR